MVEDKLLSKSYSKSLCVRACVCVFVHSWGTLQSPLYIACHNCTQMAACKLICGFSYVQFLRIKLSLLMGDNVYVICIMQTGYQEHWW